MSRTRAFAFTINNYTDDHCINLINLSVKYMIFAFEVCPNTGTPHIQGYVYFRDPTDIRTTCKRLGSGSWCKPAEGNSQQNHDYVSKTGIYTVYINGVAQPPNQTWEFGSMPTQGRATWHKIKEVMKDPKSNPHLFNQYHKTYKYIKSLKKKDHERRIYVLKYEDRFKFASQCESVMMHDELDAYDNEQVIFRHAYDLGRIVNWYNGFPPKIKRGYEVITIDPEIIAITYMDVKEVNFIYKELGDIVPEIYS